MSPRKIQRRDWTIFHNDVILSSRVYEVPYRIHVYKIDIWPFKRATRYKELTSLGARRRKISNTASTLFRLQQRHTARIIYVCTLSLNKIETRAIYTLSRDSYFLLPRVNVAIDPSYPATASLVRENSIGPDRKYNNTLDPVDARTRKRCGSLRRPFT